MIGDSKRPVITGRAQQRGREVLALRALGYTWSHIRRLMERQRDLLDRLHRRAPQEPLAPTQIVRWRKALRREVPGSRWTRADGQVRALFYESPDELVAEEHNARSRAGHWTGRCPLCRHPEHDPGGCCRECAEQVIASRSLAHKVERGPQ